MIEMQITGDRELKARFALFPANLRQVIFRKFNALAIQLAAHIKQDKLSGQVLKVQSGDLRDSITEEVTQTATSVTAHVFSAGNLIYAPVQEYGGEGPYDIYPVSAKALAFMINGKMVFAKHVVHPALKERSYMRTGLADFAPKIIESMQSAPREAWK